MKNLLFQKFTKASEKGAGEWRSFNIVQDGLERRVQVSARHIIGSNPRERVRRELLPFEWRSA